MATPTKEENGKTWGIMAKYTDSRGMKHRKYKGGFETKAKAQKWCASYIVEMTNSSLIKQELTFNEIIDMLLYEKEHIDKIAQSTMGFYEENFETIKKEFGFSSPNKMTVVILQDFVNSFLQKPRKCKSICQCLSLLYNYMERVDLIDRNLYLKLNVPEYRAKETNFYDLDTYKLLLGLIEKEDNFIYTPILLMGSLGLRPSEVLALTELDISDGMLRIDKAKVVVRRKNKPRESITGSTKTEKSNRSFPLDQDFIEKIQSYKLRHKIASSFLCVTETGEPLKNTVLENNLEKIIEKYHLPHLTPYGLRHTFGQIQKSIGTDIYTISRIMGHSNITTTTKTYFHNDNILNKNAISNLTGLINQK